MRLDSDLEPLTPASRFFVQPEIQAVIHAIFEVANPIDLGTLKAELESTFLKRYSRFSSILVRDERGREHWKRVNDVDMDKHVFEVREGGDEAASSDFVNEYVASIAISPPLDPARPLWEVHVLPKHRCYIMRLHHALGDGISLMSLFLSGCRRVEEPQLLPSIPGRRGGSGADKKDAPRPRLTMRTWLRRAAAVAWYTLVFVVDMVLRSLWRKDEKTAISGGTGVELWPRKLEVATFDLDDLKTVKNAVGSTINDVLIGVIACGLSKYLEQRSPELKRPLRISGLAMVNTRQQPGLQEISNMLKDESKARWGNQIGYVVLPTDLHKSCGNSLSYVTRAKAMMEKKKLSLEAHFSYASGALVMSLFGPKVATAINYRIMVNTTFTFSNVVGPSEDISFAGNPITTFRVTSTSLPHAITMHMVSYKGRADLQILVAKDIIPDSRVLKRCFEEALEEMKSMALAKVK